MSGGGKSVCKGRMGSSVVSDVDKKDLANNETKLKKVITLLCFMYMKEYFLFLFHHKEAYIFIY